MLRVFLAAWAVTTLPASSSARETTVRLSVRPAPAPTPALKYQLLPELTELKPGNPAQNYWKCFMEQRPFFYSAKATAARARYQKTPLADLPLGELAINGYGGGALRQADWAARLSTLDWEALERIQRGDVEAIPGELGPLQVLASALHVRFRAEVAGKHFDDALRTAKTMFALSRHLGEHPTEVANLIGLWAASLTLDTLAEMVQQPGCPNLYWALTDLPCPVVGVRTGVHGQNAIAAAELRPLHDRGPMTEAELAAFVGRLSGLLSYAREQAGRAPWNVRAILHARAGDARQVSSARRRLVEAGYTEDRLNKLPSLQVILLDENRAYELARDERKTLLALPLWQTGSLAGEDERKFGVLGVFADLLPDVIKLRLAQGQLEQQIALLRHVEAVRLHAAEHDGKLPAKLCDFSVPLPNDPVTGKPFVYWAEAATAHIRGGPIRIAERGPGTSFHYEVTVQHASTGQP